MHLHNYLVTYKNRHTDAELSNQEERSIFVNDSIDNGNTACVTGNDFYYDDRGRPSNSETKYRLNGIGIRDTLRDTVQNQNMHRPQLENTVAYDASNHMHVLKHLFLFGFLCKLRNYLVKFWQQHHLNLKRLFP